MTADFEVIDLSDEQHEESYQREKAYDEVKPSFKKPWSAVAHATSSRFGVPNSIVETPDREKRLSHSNDRGQDEIWPRESRPATNPFARQPSQSSKSTFPNHGNIGVSTNEHSKNMAYSPGELAPSSKKRRIDSIGTNAPSGNESPQWASNGPLPANTNTTTPFQPLTPVRTPARVPPSQYGMFSKQARSQRNGTQATLQPAPPGLDLEAPTLASSFTTALQTALPLLQNLDSHFLHPLIDLAKKVQTLETTLATQTSEIRALKIENVALRDRVDGAVVEQAKRAKRAIGEVNEKGEELHVRGDGVEGGEPVPGGEDGGVGALG